MLNEPRFYLSPNGVPVPISRYDESFPDADAVSLSTICTATHFDRDGLLSLHAMVWPGEGYSDRVVSMHAVAAALGCTESLAGDIRRWEEVIESRPMRAG